MNAQDLVSRPIFATRAINVRGREFLPGDELPQPPSLVERGLATTNPAEAATLREMRDVQRDLRDARQRAYELEARLAELHDELSRRRTSR